MVMLYPSAPGNWSARDGIRYLYRTFTGFQDGPEYLEEISPGQGRLDHHAVIGSVGRRREKGVLADSKGDG